MIRLGMKNGPMRFTPFSRRICSFSSMVARPPMPAPMMAPTRSGSSRAMSRPASFTAMSPAARANWMKRSFRRASFFSMKRSGSKPFTSPAMRVGKVEASKRVMGPMPLRPATIAFQDSSTPIPTGLSRPSPVITTRRCDMLPPPLRSSARTPRGPAPRQPRPAPPLLLVGVDVVDGVLDGLDVLGLLVGDLDLELLLHGHHQLDDVQRVGAQVLDEARGGLDLLLGDAQLLGDDALHLLLHVASRHVASSVGVEGPSGPRRHMYMPPFTRTTSPVTYAALSLASQATQSATSCAVPSRASGIISISFCRAASGSAAVMSVSMKPGATALTRMLREASSRATDLVRPMRPTLAAAQPPWPGFPISPTTEVRCTLSPPR